jgi:hypothetical protein
MKNFPISPIIGDKFDSGTSVFEWTGTVWLYVGPSQTGVSIADNTKLYKKVAGRANAGTYIGMGNWAFTMWVSGNRSMVIKNTSGTTRSWVGATNGVIAGGYVGQTVGGTLTSNQLSYVASNYAFNAIGNLQEFYFTDTLDYSSYRVSLMVGPVFNNNPISIEQLN